MYSCFLGSVYSCLLGSMSIVYGFAFVGKVCLCYLYWYFFFEYIKIFQIGLQFLLLSCDGVFHVSGNYIWQDLL
jgi:hypothetical protein